MPRGDELIVPALRAMQPFRRRGYNLTARYGAVSTVGFLRGTYWAVAYSSARRLSEVLYTVASYQTPLAWVDFRGCLTFAAPYSDMSRTTARHMRLCTTHLAVDMALVDELREAERQGRRRRAGRERDEVIPVCTCWACRDPL